MRATSRLGRALYYKRITSLYDEVRPEIESRYLFLNRVGAIVAIMIDPLRMLWNRFETGWNWKSHRVRVTAVPYPFSKC